MKAQMQATPRTTPRRWVTIAALALLGCLNIVLGVWAVILDNRLTPLYQDVVCEQLPPGLDRNSQLSTVELHLVSETVCHNPNPYTVTLESSKEGKVYVGESIDYVASITDIPPTILPAGGNGTIRTSVSIPISAQLLGGDIFSGLGFLFGAQFPIYVELGLKIVVDVNLIFGTFTTNRDFDRKCGLNVELRNLQLVKGAMACGTGSFEDLVLPDADTTGHTGSTMVISAESAKKDIEEGEKAKTWGLGIAKVAGFSLGALLLTVSASLLICALRRNKAATLEARELPHFTTKHVKAETVGASAPEGNSAESATKMEV